MGAIVQVGAGVRTTRRSHADINSVARSCVRVLLSSDEPRRWFFRVVAVLAAASLLFGLDAAATHAFAGNSDGATVVLEGAALRHGHLLLSG